MNTYSITDRGLTRTMNQDCYRNYFHHRFSLLLVADGMGGHQAGEVASRMAVDVACEYIMEHRDRPDTERLLREAVEEANRQIYAKSQSDPKLYRMGTTLVVVLVENAHALIAHVGDSRAYLLREGELRQLTRDHSVVWDLVESGVLTEEEASVHPERNTLTRAVGTDADVAVDINSLALETEDCLLLCTDGLTKMVPDEDIAQVLAEQPDVRAAAEKLVEMANKTGGLDNITVTLYQAGVEDESNRTE